MDEAIGATQQGLPARVLHVVESLALEFGEKPPSHGDWSRRFGAKAHHAHALPPQGAERCHYPMEQLPSLTVRDILVVEGIQEAGKQ